MINPYTTTVYLVRHGQAVGNKLDSNNVVLGQLDSPLTPLGRRQAISLDTKLKGIALDAIYSSDLERAYDTALVVARGRGLKVHTSKLIRERFTGLFQGQTEREISKRYTKTISIFNSLSQDQKLLYKFDPSQESATEVVHRFKRFLKVVQSKCTGKSILVVSHSSLIGSYLVNQGMISYKGWFGSSGIKNAGIIKLTFDNRLKSWLIDQKSGKGQIMYDHI